MRRAPPPLTLPPVLTTSLRESDFAPSNAGEELHADLIGTAPDDLGRAENARGIDLQLKQLGKFESRGRSDARAHIGDVDDLAVNHRQYAAGIGPGKGIGRATLPHPPLGAVSLYKPRCQNSPPLQLGACRRRC